MCLLHVRLRSECANTGGSEGVRTPFATSSVCFPLEYRNRSKSLKKFSKFAQNRWLATARKPHMFLIVCQQHAWKVLAQCANSRVRASVGTSSVRTLDMSVPMLRTKTLRYHLPAHALMRATHGPTYLPTLKFTDLTDLTDLTGTMRYLVLIQIQP